MMFKKRRKKLLNSYFKDGWPSADGDEIRISKRRWPIVMVILIIFAIMLMVYANPVVVWLSDTASYKEFEVFLRQFFDYQIPLETRISFIHYFGLAVFLYFLGKLLEIKFPGVVSAFIVLIGGGLFLWFSSKLGGHGMLFMQEIISLKYAFQVLKEIQETQIVSGIQFFGSALSSIGIIMMFYAFIHPIPSDAKVDEWIRQDIDLLWYRALNKLQIREEDIITEKDHQFKVFFPDDTLYYQDESPSNNRTILANFFHFIGNSIRICLWPSAEIQYDDDELEIGREDWMAKLGRDHLWRYTEYGVIFIFPTEKFMGYYECQYACLRDTVIAEMSGHHYYDDVVAVHLSEAKNRKKRLGAIKVTKAQILEIWLRGSKNITKEIVTNILVQRKLFGRFGPMLHKHDPLETEVDIVARNLNALLDDKKQ